MPTVDQDNDTLERLRRVCETNLARYYAEAVGILSLIAGVRSCPASVEQRLAVEGQHQKAESALDGYLTAERLRSITCRQVTLGRFAGLAKQLPT